MPGQTSILAEVSFQRGRLCLCPEERVVGNPFDEYPELFIEVLVHRPEQFLFAVNVINFI